MTPRLISIDFETRSPVDLTVAGVHRYAEHADTDVWCMAYCLTDDPNDVKVWEREEIVMPADLLAALEDGAYLRAWNASFERIIWNTVMVEKYGWPALPTERFVCAMAMAAAAALPLSLDKAATALGLPQQKDMDGRKLMLKMCRPRSVLTGFTALVKGEPSANYPATYDWWDEPEMRVRLSAYCAQDVRTEMAAWKATPPAMNARERRIWLLDQKINDRGIRLDLPLIRAAHQIVRTVQPAIDASVSATTGDIGIRQVAKLKEWLLGRGVDLDSLNKASIEEALTNRHLDQDVREVLEARRDGAKSSTSKYATMLAAVCRDGRVRGTMQYYGATTGRWAGRGIQPHNNPIPSRKITPEILDDIGGGDVAWIEAMHGAPLKLLSDTLRSVFIASDGMKLAVADYSTIEARVVAWLAGQEDLLDAFRRKAKLYEEFAGQVFDVDWRTITKDDPRRQGGKIGVLGCGFGMGPDRLVKQFGVEPELAKKIVKTFRSLYSKIPELWSNMNNAANESVLKRCEVAVEGTNGKLRFECKGTYLLLHLPSGRALWYHQPQVVRYWVRREEPALNDDGTPMVDPVTGDPVMRDTSFEAIGVEVSTLNPVTKQWQRQRMYGGLWAENATQAVARDIMADGMLRCEDDAIPCILSVHDEAVAELAPHRTLEEFVNHLTTIPAWAEGCPIAAEGYLESRYRK